MLSLTNPSGLSSTLDVKLILTSSSLPVGFIFKNTFLALDVSPKFIDITNPSFTNFGNSVSFITYTSLSIVETYLIAIYIFSFIKLTISPLFNNASSSFI